MSASGQRVEAGSSSGIRFIISALFSAKASSCELNVV